MPYKIFVVEDEIATREGIRDNVDWKAHGFEYCGEAPDGEMALPLLQTLNPDVLITDIRMPFMDGLQLSQIVRARQPQMKIIILSGHDEFEYAQQAVKLGVFEYLLKPITPQDVHQVLSRAAAALDKEGESRRSLQELQGQLAQNRTALRERFLLRLVTGAASSAEAIETSGALGLDLVARCYLVVVIKIEAHGLEHVDYQRCQQAQQLIGGLVENNPDVLLLTKDVDESVLVLKGASPENLYEERELLLSRAAQPMEQIGCELIVGSGAPQSRITDICRSFADATKSLQNAAEPHQGRAGFARADLVRLNKSAVEDYLRLGTAAGFDALFTTLVRPLGEGALRSSVVRAFIFTDIVLAAAKFVDELGGDVAAIVPELGNLEAFLAGMAAGRATVEQFREQGRQVLARALAFRDGRVASPYAGVIRQAQTYIESHYQDPELSLNGVAAQVNLSASHFSTVFGQETGLSFKEYLTEMRVKKAKELLRTTTMKAFEICYQVGYNDPHYFSHVFRKHTGLTPMEFRAQVPAG